MVRILHLTDFHLDFRTLKDWNNFYKDAFFAKLTELNLEKPIDFVLFTGDLLDKGGKDFKGAKKGFEEFKNFRTMQRPARLRDAFAVEIL